MVSDTIGVPARRPDPADAPGVPGRVSRHAPQASGPPSCSRPTVAALRGHRDRIRSASFPTGVKDIVTSFVKLDKSVHRLDEVDSERPCSLKTLLHASLIASLIAAVLAHTHNLKTRPQQA